MDSGHSDVISVLAIVVDAACESVAKTPTLLPVLIEAGVVDVGAQGLYTLLEGALIYLCDEKELIQLGKPQVIGSRIPLAVGPERVMTKEEEVPYGFCTEFLLDGENLDPDQLRRELVDKGQSLIVVGDEFTARVHMHNPVPDDIIRHVSSLGLLQNVRVRNMDEQHEEYLIKQKERMSTPDIAVVAIVTGDGLADVFTDLGGSAVIPGG